MCEDLLTAGGEAHARSQVTHSKYRDSIRLSGRQCVITPQKGE